MQDQLNQTPPSRTLNVRGELWPLWPPRVMGIVNVTPDSFFAGSRAATSREVELRVSSMLEDGADIIDVGGYSSRPGAAEVSAGEEYSRLAAGLEVIRGKFPDAVVSVDTFRAEVARRCIEEWGVEMINDIGGGTLDPGLWDVVASLKPVYIMMHTRGTPATMQTLTDYDDVTCDVIRDLAEKCDRLASMGVPDIVVDPGFGFAKTIDQNYRLLAELEAFRMLGRPLLVGLSRKSMIYKPLGITPAESEAGTITLGTVALLKGADIIRVHDVREAARQVRLLTLLANNTPARPCAADNTLR